MTTLVLGAQRPLGLALVRAVLDMGAPVVAAVQAPARLPPALHDLRDEFPGLLTPVAWQPGSWAHAAAVRRAIIAELPIPPAQSDEPDDAVSDLVAVTSAALQQELAQLLPATLAALQLVAALQPARALIQASWLGSIGEKIRGGGYAVATAYAAHLMLVRTAAMDLQRAGICTVVGNAGRYRLDLAGPGFHADIDDVARGLLAALDAADGSGEPAFVDWRGTPRSW
ncbi:MAG: hypothetical protein IT355_00960 [Gemmatimonadaceae bacterium]|nr:hypothetical protein [Gemmatimonadaceae bacterium]